MNLEQNNQYLNLFGIEIVIESILMGIVCVCV